MTNQTYRKGKIQSISNRIISLLLSICIVGQSSTAFAMQTPEQQREAFVSYLQEEQDRYKTLFDQEALLDELDYDEENIIDFVTNKIVYQAYDGVLRGAKGTLIGRAGNSHDQAITLAGMLKDAGLEAEILVGELTEEQASELNLNIASPELDELENIVATNQSTIAKQISEKAEELAQAEGESISSIMEETDALAERIFNQIPEEKLDKGKDAFRKSVLNSAISYRWVRYRLSPGDKWVNVHPAYNDAENWQLTPLSIEKNSVNPNDLQKVSAEVWIENSEGEKHSITGLWKRPAANLLDHTLSIEIGSDSMLRPDLVYQQDEIVKQSNFFFVKVDGKLPEAGRVFDLNGNVYPGDSIAGLNSVFSTFKNKTQKAVDALNDVSLSKKTEVNGTKKLTRVWLEFTFEKPNIASRKVERVIFDKQLLNETDLVATRLLQRWDIDIAITHPIEQFYHDRKLQQVIREIEGLKKLQSYLETEHKGGEKNFFQKYVSTIGSPSKRRLIHLRSIFDKYEANENIISYLGEPSILAIRRGINFLNGDRNYYEMTDIVSNHRWSFESINSTYYASPKTSIKYGVWQTKLESTRLIEDKSITSATSSFDQLKGAKNKLNIEPEEVDVNAGSGDAWWQVDFQTGSTVGMMSTDMGVGGSESATYVILTGISVASLYYGLYQCHETWINEGGGYKEGGNWKLVCCGFFNITMYAIGALLISKLAIRLDYIAPSGSFSTTWDYIGLISSPCDLVAD